jgi:hypothetical protein
MSEKRIHLFRDKKRTRRTTVSIEDYLYGLLAIHLGYVPDSKEARQVVTEFLQNKLFEKHYYDKGRFRVSQFLKERVIFELVGEELSEKYMDWKLRDEF